ncbi:MAG: hypothetical protein HY302_16040 [Opitutae bacterium]|nr:hypothetical protein [Opitutae bacterium]
MNIKIHLDAAESDPIVRLAEALNVQPEDVVYTAVNRLMMHARESDVHEEIIANSRSRADNLPLWADTAGSVHVYEGMPDCRPEKSKYSL